MALQRIDHQKAMKKILDNILSTYPPGEQQIVPVVIVRLYNTIYLAPFDVPVGGFIFSQCQLCACSISIILKTVLASVSFSSLMPQTRSVSYDQVLQLTRSFSSPIHSPEKNISHNPTGAAKATQAIPVRKKAPFWAYIFCFL